MGFLKQHNVFFIFLGAANTEFASDVILMLIMLSVAILCVDCLLVIHVFCFIQLLLLLPLLLLLLLLAGTKRYGCPISGFFSALQARLNIPMVFENIAITPFLGYTLQRYYETDFKKYICKSKN